MKKEVEVNLPDTLIKSEPLNDSNSSSCPLATNHLVKKEESLSTKNASSMHLETDLLAKGNPAIDANKDGDNAGKSTYNTSSSYSFLPPVGCS